MNGYTSATTFSAHDVMTCPICKGIREVNDQQKESTVTTTTRFDQLLENMYGFPKAEAPSTLKATPEQLEAKAKAKATADRMDRERREDSERQYMGTAASVVDQELRRVPTSANGLAGYLQGAGYKGDKTGAGNALAMYLNAKVETRIALSKILFPSLEGIFFKVFVEANGLIIESKRLQLCIDPPYWQRSFVEALRRGDYPQLLK